MAIKYDGNDLLWSPEGDLVISSIGDLDSTNRHATLLSVVQEIQTRVRSDINDWATQPSIGASLSELIGKPCNKDVAEIGKTKIQAALTRGGFLPANSFKVRYIPISKNEVVYNIIAQVPGAGPQQIINVSVAVNLSNADIAMIYDQGISGAYDTNLTKLSTIPVPFAPIPPAPSQDTTPPRVSSAAAINTTTIQVVFNEAMSIDASLTNIENYGVTGDTSIEVSLVTVVDALTVNLTVSEMLEDGSYTVEVNGVFDDIGNPLNPSFNTASFIGIGTLPRILSAVPLDEDVIRVVFNEAMLADAALTDADNYVFDGDETLTAQSIAIVNSTTVDITTVESMVLDVSYTLTITGVKDAATNVLDPSYDMMIFVGVARPRLLSAEFVDDTHIDAEFDQDMGLTGLTTPSNYLVEEVSEAPRVLLATSTDADAELVDVWFSKDIEDLGLTEEVNYTVQTFTPPKVIRATCEDDAAHVVVEFDKEIPDTHLLDIDNYVLYGHEVDYPDVAVPHAPKILSAVWERSDSLLVTFSEVVTDLTAEDVDNYVLYGREVYGFYIVSATQVDTTHIDVVFSSIPDETSAETTTNYVISGAGTPTVSAAELLAAKPNVVRLAIPFTVSGTYTVTVSNVTSIRSETLNLSQKSATWTHGMIISVHASLPTNLLGYWSLDSNANDVTGNGYNGSAEGGPLSYVAAKISNGVQLDGSSQDIDLGTSTALAPNYLTVSAWVYISGAAATDWQDPICRFAYDTSVPNVAGASYLFQFVRSTKACVFGISNGTAFGYSSYTYDLEGAWNHWVGTYDGINVKQYMNGSLVGSAPIAGTMNAPAGVHTLIGSRMGDYGGAPYLPDSRTDRFKGTVDEVGIWSRALTAAEVYCLYNRSNGIAY